MYHKKESKFFDEQEEKRIYTSVLVTPVSLLENCHPIKYRLEGKDTVKDVGNVVKRINELDDNNIFYVWKCGFPKNYMFVLERDIGLWKFYNPKAYVTPKTIKKIILSTKGMCNSMHKILEESGDKSTIHDVRNSFCEFISRMVEKMNPEIHEKLDKWKEGRGYKEYILSLNKKINELTPYQGFEEDQSFYDRLPIDVKLKLEPKPIVKKEEFSDLELELAPKEASLIKPPKKTRKRKPVQDVEAKFETFTDIDPLKNSTSFFRYYRSVIKSQDQTAEFNDYQVELQPAAGILDKLKNDNQDEIFLRSWILFYAELKLKGNNIKNKEKTSLNAFQKTYEEYNNRYIGCGV
jgi:hypothetical protein